MKTLAMMLAAVAICGATVRAEAPKAKAKMKAETNAPVMIPDPSWTPKAGDRATVDVEGAPSAKDYYTYSEFMKFAAAKDQVGLEGHLARQNVRRVPRGTGVLILERYRRDRPFVSRSYSASGLQHAIQGSASAAPDPDEDEPLEVRFVDGPFKDQVGYVPERMVARLIPRPEPKAASPKAKAKARRKTRR